MKIRFLILYGLLSLLPMLSYADNSVCHSIATDNKGLKLTWGESYKQSALLMEFERTKDAAKLKQFIQRADCVLNKRDDKRNTDTKAATWSFKPRAEGSSKSCSGPGADGMILSPMAKYLRLYKEQSQLFAQPALQELKLQSVKDRFETAIGQTLSYHDTHSWNKE